MPFAAITVSGSGDNVVVAAVAGMAIRVYGYALVAAGSVTAEWKSGTSGAGSDAALSGAMSLIIGVPVVCPPGPMTMAGRGGYLETAPGEALNLYLGSGVQVSGHLEYGLHRT